MDKPDAPPPYVLDDQVGYLLRLASQRHAAIFQARMAHGLTPTQFSTLIRLAEIGRGSQNQLGRLAGIDAATTKGVVDRLKAKGLVTLSPDAADARRRVVSLSPNGRRLIDTLTCLGHAITGETLEPLDAEERRTLVALLRRIT